MVLTEKDIAVVIATYNRSDEVDRTLNMMIKNFNLPGAIFVIDQSKDDLTKNVVSKYSQFLPVNYVHSSIPSSSISKNLGIKKSKKFKLILVLDDDVDLLNGYFKEALKEFNTHKELMALGGDEVQPIFGKKSKFAKLWLKLFFLPRDEENKFRIISPYGNIGCSQVTKEVRDAEWLRGFNMFFRSEVFNNYKMPESLGYNVLEDIDSSYYIFKKYGKGSLLVTPKCKTHHRFSQTARYAEKKRIFVNHEDHFYFYYKYFPKFTDKLKFAWNLIGLTIGHVGKFIFRPNKNNYLSMKYNLQAISYCNKNKNSIRKGKLRSFLNNDLSLKEEYAD